MTNKKIHRISAKEGFGLDELVRSIAQEVDLVNRFSLN